MQNEWIYPVELRHEDGDVHAYAAALPEAIASGPTEADALREMGHALAAAVRGRIKDGMDLGEAALARPAERHRVALPARLAAKAAIYAAWKASGLAAPAAAGGALRRESLSWGILWWSLLVDSLGVTAVSPVGVTGRASSGLGTGDCVSPVDGAAGAPPTSVSPVAGDVDRPLRGGPPRSAPGRCRT